MITSDKDRAEDKVLIARDYTQNRSLICGKDQASNCYSHSFSKYLKKIKIVEWSQIEMGKFMFCGHTKHFQSTWVRRVMPIFVTLIGLNLRCASYKTAGAYTLFWFWQDSLYLPLIHLHVITFCPIRLSKLSWAYINEYLHGPIFFTGKDLFFRDYI